MQRALHLGRVLQAFNAIYKRYFPKNPPARIFFCVPEWTGSFDIEIDCIAVTKS
jgi:2-iminobutanoate/2-iminopropanoate deaminase